MSSEELQVGAVLLFLGFAVNYWQNCHGPVKNVGGVSGFLGRTRLWIVLENAEMTWEISKMMYEYSKVILNFSKIILEYPKVISERGCFIYENPRMI